MKQLTHMSGGIRYELCEKIAEGGMGIVWLAKQQGVDHFEKTVAIKVIREEFSAIEEFRSNFIGEARLVADLIHTNIVQTYHLGEIDGQYFMVMEYVEGNNLEEFNYQHASLERLIPVDLAAFVISRICRGLSYAHSKRDAAGRRLSIVHRDVSPRNIMLGHEGDVKLTDFGIAKARDLMYNEEGEVIAGKDEYLSPEQARCEITDSRADLFSCGVTLAEMIAGRNIFEDEDPETTRRNIQEMELPDFRDIRPEIDERLNSILRKALERPRDKRYQTAAEMLTELEMYLYSDGYGPTNEKLAVYTEELFANGRAFVYDDADTSGSLEEQAKYREPCDRPEQP